MTSLLPPLDPLTQASIGRGQSAIYNTKPSAFVTVMTLDKGDWASATDREAVYELQNRMRAHVRKAAAGVPIADPKRAPSLRPEQDMRRPSVLLFHPKHRKSADTRYILTRSNASTLAANSLAPMTVDLRDDRWNDQLDEAWHDRLAAELEYAGAEAKSENDDHWYEVSRPTAVILATNANELAPVRAAAHEFMLREGGAGAQVGVHDAPLPVESVHRVVLALE